MTVLQWGQTFEMCIRDSSYRYFMDRHLFDRVNINKANTYVPDGTAADPDAFCREYDAEIKAAGGIGIRCV